MRKSFAGTLTFAAVAVAVYLLISRALAGYDAPAKGRQSATQSAKSGDTGRNSEPRTPNPEPSSLRSAKEIERHFDRLKIEALAEYVGTGSRPDLETAYMLMFNAVIEHDLFADYEKVADRYLKDRPSGAVTPLAHAIKSMALACRGEFTQAAKAYGDLVGEVSPQNVRFAWSFGDTLARLALANGEYQAVRDIYSGVAKKFPNEPDIQEHMDAQLQKLDLVGKAAPGFEVRDLDGKKLALDDYRSKVTLVDFWATWCGPCVAEMPNVRAVYDKYRSRGFEVLGISLDEDPEAVRAFLKEHKLPWRQIVSQGDKEKDIVQRYGVTTIPATFLIDGTGKIQRVDLRGDGLDKAVTALLERKTTAR